MVAGFCFSVDTRKFRFDPYYVPPAIRFWMIALYIQFLKCIINYKQSSDIYGVFLDFNFVFYDI